jgi:hypothetical protein
VQSAQPDEYRRRVPHVDPSRHRRRRLGENQAVLDPSRLQHAVQLDALRQFARRRRVSEEVVVAVFERERLQLTQGAKVERFVDVLAEKRARRAARTMKR